MVILTALQEGRGRITERVSFRFKHRRILHVWVVWGGSIGQVTGQHRGGRCRRLDVPDRYRAGHGGTGLHAAVGWDIALLEVEVKLGLGWGNWVEFPGET